MSLRNKIVLVISIFVFLVFLSGFLYRNSILELGIHKVQEKLLDRYRIALTINDYGFEGIRDVYFRKIILAPLTGDTLVTIQNVELKISLGLLMRLKLGFKEIYIDSIFIDAVKKDSASNYSFLTKKTVTTDTIQTEVSFGYHERISGILEKVNRVFNSTILMNDITFRYQLNDKIEFVKIPQLAFNGEQFACDVVTTSLTAVASYRINGNVNTKKATYKFSVAKLNDTYSPLPFFDLADSLKIAFDSAEISISASDERKKLPVSLIFDIKNLILNHWRISQTDVVIPDFNCALNSTINDDSFKLDSGSIIKLGKLPVNITASYERKPDRRIKLDVQYNSSAQNFFNSLPQGMFSTLKGLQASGDLKYNLHFNLDRNDPDHLVFDSKLEKENFRINKYGEENFSRINDPFIFTAMDHDREMRYIFIGVGNPMFTPLNEISDYLKNTVLTSEDPSFFLHGGFVEDAFRESIAENIKQGRFARGGSTITMQLVKNVFLSRNKTVSRKLEEALIVWLIEKNRLVSKERMFEIYLNIIELGPDVYGIGEASQFYFKKHPRDLTLSESIYLSEIIPHPKYFKYAFDSTGHLKPNHKGYFDLIGNRLLIREKISQADLDSINPHVLLKGRALEFILPSDTIPADSTEME